jgi:dihydroflavonol-4-reductase
VKPALVTGATGFVGWHVARALLDRGQSVRALARNPASLRELEGVEAIKGDLRDPASLQRAVAGCSTVYHVAADYRLWTRDPQQMHRSNVDGTRAMLDAARQAGVERFVYTSTVGCIAVPKDVSLHNLGDETMVAQLTDMQGPYKESKLLAEHVALEFARDGFPVVIVNPTAPVGDHDFKPTPTGKIIVDFVRGAMPAYLDTGLNVVDVRDVAQAHLTACERGRIGERYILGAENMTLRQIFEALAPVAGRKPPAVQIPYAVAYAAGVASTTWANLTGKEPMAPLDGVKMARKKMWVRHDKATRELDYHPGPAAAALTRAVEWFKSNGYL